MKFKPIPPLSPQTQTHFWALVNIGAPEACWLWTGGRKGSHATGYGAFYVTVRPHHQSAFVAHRVAYELERGPVPSDMVLDHLCREPLCCNPSHLEIVTNRENVQRGKPLHQTHCKHGHEFTAANTMIRGASRRECRECRRIVRSANKQWRSGPHRKTPGLTASVPRPVTE